MAHVSTWKLTASVIALATSTLLTGCKSCGDEKESAPKTKEGDAASRIDPNAGPVSFVDASAAAGSAEHRPAALPPVAAGRYTFLFAAARGVTLTEEQKTKLGGVTTKLREGGGPGEAGREETKAFRAELAAEVKAGKIEPSKLEPHYAAIEKSQKARHEREAEAVNGLHATLDSAQRAQVVSTAKEREAKRGRFAAGAAVDGGAKAMQERRTKHRVERYKRMLNLDEAQEKKVEAAIAKEDKGDAGEEAKKRNEALLAAFEKDTFDAKKVDAPDPKKARATLEREPQLLAQIVPILKPEQRDKLAADLERGGHGGGRFRHPAARLPDQGQDDDDDEP